MPYVTESKQAIPLHPVMADEYDDWLDNIPGHQRAWLQAAGFKARPGQWCSLPRDDGHLDAVVFGMQAEGWISQLAGLATKLPAGDYRLVADWDPRTTHC